MNRVNYEFQFYFLPQSDFGSYYTHMANSIFSHDTIPPEIPLRRRILRKSEGSRSDRAAQTFSLGRASSIYA